MSESEKELLAALEAQITWWQQLPCGVDESAEENDLSPDDAIAHIAGLAVREAQAAIAKAKRGEEKHDRDSTR